VHEIDAQLNKKYSVDFFNIEDYYFLKFQIFNSARYMSMLTCQRFMILMQWWDHMIMRLNFVKFDFSSRLSSRLM